MRPRMGLSDRSTMSSGPILTRLKTQSLNYDQGGKEKQDIQWRNPLNPVSHHNPIM